jgi:hypothetical protein
VAAFAGKKADFYLTSGASVSMPLEAMSDVSALYGAAVRTIYAQTNAVKRYFDPTSPLTFDISLNSGGAWNPVVPDFVRAGTIAFIASQQAAPAAMFRVNTGQYLPYSRVGGGHEWEMNPNTLILDATEFGMTSKRHVASVTSGTIKLKRWWLEDSLRSVMVVGARVAVILYVDATAQPASPRYECLALMKTDAIKVAVKAQIQEDLQLEIQSDVSYLSG